MVSLYKTNDNLQDKIDAVIQVIKLLNLCGNILLLIFTVAFAVFLCKLRRFESFEIKIIGSMTTFHCLAIYTFNIHPTHVLIQQGSIIPC